MNKLIQLGILFTPILAFGQETSELDFNDTVTHQIGFSTNVRILFHSNPRVYFAEGNCFGEQYCSYQEIERIANFHKTHPMYLIEIGVHSDQRGHDVANLTLSQMRANNVKSELGSKFSADTSMFIARGYGEAQPVVEDSIIQAAATQVERDSLYALNRRTVITLLKK